MRTIDFVAYETFRRPGKSVTGICYILLAVSIFVAAETVNEALRDRTKEQLLRFGANILVQPKGRAFDTLNGEAEGDILLPEKYAEDVRSIKHKKMLVAVSPKLYQRFEVDGQSISVAGITPDEQRAKPWWFVGTHLLGDAFPGEKEILLGHHVASRLGMPEEIRLGDDTFQVNGVLDETGSPDDFTAFIRLEVLQRLAHRPGMVSLIEVSTSCIACKEMDVRDVRKQIDEAVPADAEVVLKSQIAEAQMGTLKKVKAFTIVTYLVVLTPCVFLLVNFMSASVGERRGEIGMLLAMGMAPRRIQQIFLLKVGIFAVTGGLLGYLFGSGASMLLGPLVADSSVSPLPHLLPGAFGLSLGLGVVSSILPLRRISRLDPIEAFRVT
ncbi:MAG: ABC transporter permease [Pirellulales bacterium]